MMLKIKWSYCLVALVLLTVGTFGCVYYYKKKSMSYVAEVAGQKITRPEFEFFLVVVKNKMESLGNLVDENEKITFWENKIDGLDAKIVAKDHALDQTKAFKIQLIKAKEKKIVLDSNDIEEINQKIREIIEKEGGQATAQSEIIKKYRVNIQQMTSIVSDLMLVEKYVFEEKKLIRCTPEDSKVFYDNNMENTESVVTIRQIFVSKKDNPLEANKKAEDIFIKVKEGEDVNVLAEKYKDDAGVDSNNSGEYTIKKGQTPKEFEDWAFQAKPGDIGLVEIDLGYYIIKKPKFDELQESIKYKVIDEKYSQKLQEFMNQERYNLIINKKVLDLIKIM